jgi:peptidoglycan/LPS O-acetylase OafA/YrhL
MLLDEERNRRIVDGLRAAGILMVILFHSLFGATKLLQEHGEKTGDYSGIDALVGEFPGTMNFAWQALGSEVIFLLSGFLLSYLLFRELKRTGRIDLFDYYVRRISRILPLYAIALLAYSFGVNWHLDDLVLNLVFLSKVFDRRTIIPVGWSLEVMMQVYLVLPFVVLLVARSRWPALLASAFVLLSVLPRWIALRAHPSEYEMPFYSLLYSGEASDLQQDLYYLLLHRATPFLLGLLIAQLAVHRHGALLRLFGRPVRGFVAVLAGIGLTVASGCLSIQDRDSWVYSSLAPEFWLWFWTFQRFVFAVGVALVLLATFHAARGLAGRIGDLFQWKLWGTFSRNIYSIYLFHFVCMIPAAAIVLVPRSTERVRVLFSQPRDLREVIAYVSVWEVLAIFALTAFFAASLASVITRYVEQPSQEWIRRRYGRRRPPAPSLGPPAGSTSDTGAVRFRPFRESIRFLVGTRKDGA